MRKTKITKFIIWICSKFSKKQIELIIKELNAVLNNNHPFAKLKDDFPQKHPHFQKFPVDVTPPLTENVKKKLKN